MQIADALRGPRVSIATGWNIKLGGREEYLVSFLLLLLSPPAQSRRQEN